MKTASKKRPAKKERKRANKGWGQKFVFVKVMRIEPPKESVFGCVYQALRKMKTGTVQELTEEAMRQGLNKYTKQNPRIQTQIKLRRLVREGSAKKEKIAKSKKVEKEKAETKPVAAPAKKAVAKKPAAKAPAAKKPASKKKTEPKKKVDADPVEDVDIENLDSSIDDGDANED
jgi:hypothetical protein